MRVAFVGKGGSGKTTWAVLFARYVAAAGEPTLLADADLNLHVPLLLDPARPFPAGRYLSDPSNVSEIRRFIRGSNGRISSLEAFVKTTPPGRGSRFIEIDDVSDPILGRMSIAYEDGLRLLVVGTHDTDTIGTACYHNNLAVFENLLSHTDDRNGWLVADMVAGIDAFSNTLFSQFDALVLVVEPTRRGTEVVAQYRSLAEAAGIHDRLIVLGNKIRSEADERFLREMLGATPLFGVAPHSLHLEACDRNPRPLDPREMEEPHRILLGRLREAVRERRTPARERLEKLHDLHRRYVAQGYIRDRLGDLTVQIDHTFDGPG
jgi:CO dehydrogenase maturation factor